MKNSRFLWFGLAMVLASCAPKVTTMMTRTYPPVDASKPVVVLGLREPVPEHAEKLGTLKIGDSGFSMDCGWETVIRKAMEETRKAGGNALKIVSHNPPDFLSSCHRLSAIMLKAEGIESRLTEPEQDSVAAFAQGATPRPGDTIRATGTPAGKVVYVKRKFPHFRAGLNGGWSYRTARLSNDIPRDFKQYMKQLKTGWQYGGDVSWFFSEAIGVGAKYSCYRSKNELENVTVYFDDGTWQTGKMSDDITIRFAGPVLSMRLFSQSRKNNFFVNFGVGYLGYKDKGVLINGFTITGSTAGLCMDVGYDFGLTKEIALSLQASLLGGSLSEYDLTDGVSTQHVTLEKGSYEGLSRIDLSVGVRFNK